MGGWVALGAAGCALAVAAGAFGAHALAERLDAHHLQLWETASRYLMYGAFGVLLAGLAAGRWPGVERAAWVLLAGSLVFAGTVGALALGGPRWLGAVTPLGGTLMILGFLLFAWSSWRG
ncbi:MAG TPA: DUF423 domain-containing protein [Thermoanaerobaculia bacterium]|jgi:uncharacterized membrane protein YgdD (TMEM256/DUF423 family)|nr:DUF423 domain-containing protein [Thermoanaerobaculia bacterium]